MRTVRLIGLCPAASVVTPENLAKAFAAASASQKREHTNENIDRGSKEAKFRPDHKYTAQDVWNWFNKKKAMKNKRGEPSVRTAQLEMLRRVAQRLCDELEETDVSAFISKTLLWRLHGGPGTGKSEVLLMIKSMFQEVCGWHMGV